MFVNGKRCRCGAILCVGSPIFRKWPEWFLQFLEKFRQMHEFVGFNNGQHLATNGCHFVPQEATKMSAGIGDHDALQSSVGSR